MKYLSLVLFIFVASVSNALTLEKYNKKPKLVVVMVIDQFRADYLTKYQKEFMPVGAKNEVGGFNYLISKGAYFPFAEYDVLQSMTCPGHAMISTGSHPYFTGISLNEWYDVSAKKKTYCAEDSEFGMSPRRLKTSTFGDELKNVSESSKVIAVALKDRSSIMLGGHRSDVTLWMDQVDLKWITSTYYQKEVPAWAKTVNERIVKSGVFKNREEAKKLLMTPVGVELTREIAEAALKSEKLGKNGQTDILAVSFSSHDMAGHTYGPNSPELKAMTLAEDKEISKFLTAIKNHMGSLNDVVIALTADHGVAPSVDYAQASKLDSGRIEYLAMYKKIYERLDQKFGRPSKEWISAGVSFNFYLNPEALKERKVTVEQVEAEVKEAMTGMPGVLQIATSSEIAKNILPTGELGKQLTRQYIAGNNGNIILIPKPFYISKGEAPVNHMTGYAYDRTVPLIILGPKIKAGVYANQAKVIDLAPTLSFINGALPPATTTGRVLSEIFE
ncbi:alkaline phosphatase family protein [Bdellovibrio sp. HCB337]|uniref:alkaline phosphatase family protein n=1 Tax=Bdellovibrio sp. HCB337 TaxID=3394358 RepID=UPI0039A45560